MTRHLTLSGESHLSDLLWRKLVLSQVWAECHQSQSGGSDSDVMPCSGSWVNADTDFPICFCPEQWRNGNFTVNLATTRSGSFSLKSIDKRQTVLLNVFHSFFHHCKSVNTYFWNILVFSILLMCPERKR